MNFRRRKGEEPDNSREPEPQPEPEPQEPRTIPVRVTGRARAEEPPPQPLPAEFSTDDGESLSVIVGKLSNGTAVTRLLARNHRGDAVVMIFLPGHVREIAAAALASADLADGLRAPVAWPTSLAPGRQRFACDQSPGDTLHVRCVPEAGTRPAMVGLTFRDGDHGSQVSMEVTPATARRVAASVLNAADHADGVEVVDAL